MTHNIGDLLKLDLSPSPITKMVRTVRRPRGTTLGGRRRPLGSRFGLRNVSVRPQAGPGYVIGGARPGAPTRQIRRRLGRLGAGVARRRIKNTMTRQVARPQLGGLPSLSSFMSSMRPSTRVKTMKRVGAENYALSNNASQLVISEGFQSAATYTWNGFERIKYIINSVPGTSPYPKQFVLERTTAEFLISNSSLATMYVDIYDVVRKRDPGYYGGDSSQDPSGNPTYDPLNAWSQGVSDQTPTSPDLTAYKQMNSLPTDSRLFRDYFKVVKRTHTALSQGSTHRHRVALAPNKLIDSEYATRINGDMSGVAVYTMIVAWGQPASIPQEEGSAIVTSASGALDIVVSSRIKYTYVQDNQVYWQRVDNLSTLTGEQVVSIGSGTIVPNAKV